jgi:hypothetical protein
MMNLAFGGDLDNNVVNVIAKIFVDDEKNY